MFVISIECLPFTKLSCSVTSSLIKLLSVNVKFTFLSLGAFEAVFIWKLSSRVSGCNVSINRSSCLAHAEVHVNSKTETRVCIQYGRLRLTLFDHR